MFKGVDTSKELSARLRQDMNPSGPGVVPPSAPPPPKEIFQKPSEPVEPKMVTETILEPQVETAPFISSVNDHSKSYLAWAAALFILPSAIFWLAVLLYVFGAKAFLLKIVTAVPFLIIVGANLILPLVSILLAWIMLARTELGDSGRLVAKLSLAISMVCLLALGWWVLDEAILS